MRLIFAALVWCSLWCAPALAQSYCPRAILHLDISTISTSGVPVIALNVGHAACGGFVITQNAGGLCVNELGAAGTTTGGDTSCVNANQPFFLLPTTGAVSVNSPGTAPIAIGGNGEN
jgi:hypothetical protein